MKQFVVNGKSIPALTLSEFEKVLASIDHPDTDEIEVSIVSGLDSSGERYYALDNSGVDVLDPHMDEFNLFWDTEWDTEVHDA